MSSPEIHTATNGVSLPMPVKEGEVKRESRSYVKKLCFEVCGSKVR